MALGAEALRRKRRSLNLVVAKNRPAVRVLSGRVHRGFVLLAPRALLIMGCVDLVLAVVLQGVLDVGLADVMGEG